MYVYTQHGDIPAAKITKTLISWQRGEADAALRRALELS